jgi:hypothetical protein
VVPVVSGEEFAQVLHLVGFRFSARNLAYARMETDERQLTVPLVAELSGDAFRCLLLASDLSASDFLELLSCVQRGS